MDNLYGVPREVQRSDKDIVILAIHNPYDIFYVADMRNKTLSSIALVMRFSGYKNRRVVDFRTRESAVDEAVELLLRFNCTKFPMPSVDIQKELKVARAMDCSSLYLKDGMGTYARPQKLLFVHATTHKEVLPVVPDRIINYNNGTTSDVQRVGIINRPRLCILPSLILLALLLVIVLLLNLRGDSEDVMYKLWVFVSQKEDRDNPRNPLYSEAVELQTNLFSSNYPAASSPDTSYGQ